MLLHMDLILIATCFMLLHVHMDLVLIATCFMSLHMDLVSVRLMFLWQALNRNHLSWGSTWWRPVGSWFWLTGCWATYRVPDTRSSCSPRWLTCWTFYRIIWDTEVCTLISNVRPTLSLSLSLPPPLPPSGLCIKHFVSCVLSWLCSRPTLHLLSYSTC